MPAFAILAHTEPKLLSRLLERLNPFPTVVHIDAKQKLEVFSQSCTEATFLKERVNVNWGGFTVVEAMLHVLNEAAKQISPDDHVVLLSGQCYPARPLGELVTFLQRSPYIQHCDASLIFDDVGYARDRLVRRWYYDKFPCRTGLSDVQNKVLRKVLAAVMPRRKEASFSPFFPVAGSQWVALTAACIKDLTKIAAEPRTRGMFNTTMAPDEIFLHTLLYNHWRVVETRVGALVPRGSRRTSEFANLHYLHPSLTNVLGLEDLDAIVASEMFLARKVSGEKSRELLDALDCRL
jgi:hypothetical protein